MPVWGVLWCGDVRRMGKRSSKKGVWCSTSEMSFLRLKTFVVTKSNPRGDWWSHDQCLGWHFTSALMWTVRGLIYWPEYVTHTSTQLSSFVVFFFSNWLFYIYFIFLLQFMSLQHCNESRKSIKLQNVGLIFGTRVRIWLRRHTVRRLSAANVSILQWQKATFLPSQYRHIYTLFFKSPYLLE